MGTRLIRFVLIGAGSLFLLGNGVRFYRLIRTHATDPFFAPHLLLVTISLILGWKIFKMGIPNSDFTRKSAISLIRSGSVLMGVWGYRLYLLSALPPHLKERGENIALGMAITYVLLGSAVMGVGLRISRSMRQMR